MKDYECSQCGEKQDAMEAFMIRDSGLCFACYNGGPGKERRAIREKEGLQEAWFKKAAEVRTPEQLTAFMKQVMDGYVHSYGTVCHAVAACALAAIWCANRMEGAHGGVTGFQAGQICSLFVQRWMLIDGPFRLVEYHDILYPQHAEKFDKRLDRRVMDWLRKEAVKKIKEVRLKHPPSSDVVEHWMKLAAGEPPFGYKLEE